MTPDWLKPMPWLNMEQQERLPSTAEGIINAAGTLGSAYFNRSRSPRPPKIHMPTTTPSITEPAIPDPVNTEFRGVGTESPLLRRKPEILNWMGGGAGGAW